MKVAIYARVPADLQTNEPQLRELRQWVERCDYDATEFVDINSDTSRDRPALDKMRKLIRGNGVRCVAVVSLDRLGRSLSHLMEVIDEMHAHRVALIATSQGIDTTSDIPTGKIQLHVLSVISKFERSLSSELVKAGLAVARSKGKVIGQPSEKLVKNWVKLVDSYLDTPIEDRSNYEALANKLGGVNKSTAWRLAMKRQEYRRVKKAEEAKKID